MFAASRRRVATDGKVSLLRQAPADGGSQVPRVSPLRSAACTHHPPDPYRRRRPGRAARPRRAPGGDVLEIFLTRDGPAAVEGDPERVRTLIPRAPRPV